MSEDEPIRLSCPDCGSALVVDRLTGQVLLHEKPKAALADFDSLLKGLDEQKERAQETFERERSALRDRDRLLEEKFKAALKRAEETPDEKPIRPFDLD